MNREVLKSHEEKIREGRKRKTGEGKQHGKCLLCIPTRGVVSTTLLQSRTWGWGERNWRCPAVLTQTFSALVWSAGRKVRVK